MNDYKNLVRLGRPQNTRYPIFLLVSIGIYLNTDTASILGLAGLYFVLYQLVTIVNNLFDLQADKINNNLQNPLTKNLLNINQVRVYFFGLLVSLVLILIYTDSARVSVVVLSSLLVGIWYSLPRIGAAYKSYLGTVILAFWYASLPTLLLWADGANLNALTAQLTFIQTLLVGSWLLTKDYKDVKGDKAIGKLTPLVKYGRVNVLYGSLALVTLTVCVVALAVFTSYTKAILLSLSLAYACIVYMSHRDKSQKRRVLTFLVLGTMQLTGLYIV